MTGPAVQSGNMACPDYSFDKGRSLIGCRRVGESELIRLNLLYISPTPSFLIRCCLFAERMTPDVTTLL
jgi:hypothetical protein